MKRWIAIGAFGLALAAIATGGLWVRSKQQQTTLKQAIERYEKRLERFPGDPDNYLKLSQLYEQLGDFDKAEEWYYKFKALEQTEEELEDKKRLRELERIARANDGQNPKGFSSGSARPTPKSSKGRQPKPAKRQRAQQAYNDAEEAYKNKDFVRAEEAYKKAIEADPNYAPPYYKLGNFKYRLQQYNEAASLYQSCLRADPAFYKARINLGVAYYNLKQLHKARQAFLKAVKGASKANDNDRLYLIHSKLGFLAKDLGRPNPEAIAHLKKAISIKRTASDHVLLGILYEAQGKSALAKGAYRTALALDSSNTEALYNLGTLLMSERKWNEALGYYNRVLKVEPSHQKALLNTAITHVLMGDRDAAKKHLDQALKQNPSNPKANIEMAKYWKEKNITSKAASHARLAIEHSESSADTAKYYNELGYIYMQTNMTNEALEAFLGAKGLEPANRDTLKSLVKVFVQQEDWSAAAKEAEVLLQLDRSEYEYYETLGKVYLKMNERQKAKQVLRRLLQRNPNYKNAGPVRELLGSIQ